ncbi:MAG: flagellar basal-body rod protein FlgF [Hyphomicrobium sp.]
MQSQLYVSYSAQIALQRRLDSIANNMANVSTAGFRGDEISFEQIVSLSGTEPTSFVSKGSDHISLKTGEFTRTGNPLDIAVRGGSWLATQAGDTVAYTRDGRMKLSETGALTSLTGNLILDTSGSPLQLEVNGPTPQIAADGTISQGQRRVGSIGLFTMDPGARLTRAEGSAIIPDIAPTPELDFNANGIQQGFVENSNVSPIEQLVRLIAVQRTFEAVTSAIKESETMLQEATRALSGA